MNTKGSYNWQNEFTVNHRLGLKQQQKTVFYPKRLPVRRSQAYCLRIASPCADGNGQPLHSALLPLATIVMLFLL
jgi:hypothetical protein